MLCRRHPIDEPVGGSPLQIMPWAAAETTAALTSSSDPNLRFFCAFLRVRTHGSHTVAGPGCIFIHPWPATYHVGTGVVMQRSDITREHAWTLCLGGGTHSPRNFGGLTTLGTKAVNDSSLALFEWILHLSRRHLTVSHCSRFSFCARSVAHTVSTVVSCTHPSDHLRSAVFASSPANGFHLNNFFISMWWVFSHISKAVDVLFFMFKPFRFFALVNTQNCMILLWFERQFVGLLVNAFRSAL